MDFDTWYQEQVDADQLWGVKGTALEMVVYLAMRRAWEAAMRESALDQIAWLGQMMDRDYEC
jgi:hypothetical protein